MSSDEDALLDSLLKAATTSLKRKASNRERVASVEPAEEPNETAGAKRKRHDEEEPEPLQPKAVKKDKKTVVNVPSAAERAEALRREKEEKEARIQGRDKDRHAPATSGPKWFDLPASELTTEAKQHLQVLNMRHVLDPKRHYKRMGKKNAEGPKFFQIGTIVEGAGEYYQRVPNRDRNKTLVEELLSDADKRKKFKEKFDKLQADRVRRGAKPIRGKGKKGGKGKGRR